SPIATSRSPRSSLRPRSSRPNGPRARKTKPPRLRRPAGRSNPPRRPTPEAPASPSVAGVLLLGNRDAALGRPRKPRSAIRDAPAQRRLHGARRDRRDARLRPGAEEVPGLAAGRPHLRAEDP